MHAELAAKNVRLLVLDVDGVLTDGGLYYDASGCVLKRFNVQDGLGMKIAAQAGLSCAVITGLDSPVVRRRVTELGVEHYYPGYHRKGPILRELSEKTGYSFDQMGYVGDDWVDAAPMSMVGFPVAVANARPEILHLAKWTTTACGGQGAVREALDFILRAQGKFDALWQDWVNP